MRYCYQCCIIAAPRPQIWIILLTGFCFLVKRRIEYIYLHTLGGDLRMKVDNFFWLKRHNQQTKFANLSTLKRKQKSDNSNPQILPHQRRNSPPSSQRQKIDQRYPPKCGLGASVGCERFKRTFNTPRLKSQIGGIGFLCFVNFAYSKFDPIPQ